MKEKGVHNQKIYFFKLQRKKIVEGIQTEVFVDSWPKVMTRDNINSVV